MGRQIERRPGLAAPLLAGDRLVLGRLGWQEARKATTWRRSGRGDGVDGDGAGGIRSVAI